jgi:hypothetical protein
MIKKVAKIDQTKINKVCRISGFGVGFYFLGNTSAPSLKVKYDFS